MSDKKLTELKQIDRTGVDPEDYFYVVHEPSTSPKNYVTRFKDVAPVPVDLLETDPIIDFVTSYVGVLCRTRSGSVYGNRGKKNGISVGLNVIKDSDYSSYGIMDYMTKLYLPPVTDLKSFGSISCAIDNDNNFYYAGYNAGGVFDSDGKWDIFHTTPGITPPAGKFSRILGMPNGLDGISSKGSDSDAAMPIFVETIEGDTYNYYGIGYNKFYNINYSNNNYYYDFSILYNTQEDFSLVSEDDRLTNIISLGGESPSVAWNKHNVWLIGKNIDHNTWTIDTDISEDGNGFSGDVQKCGIGMEGSDCHIYVITQDGDSVNVYFFGSNDKGAFTGSSSYNDDYYSKWKLVQSEQGTYKDFKIEGGTNPALLLEDGRLFKCGDNTTKYIAEDKKKDYCFWTETASDAVRILSPDISCRNAVNTIGAYYLSNDDYIYVSGKEKKNWLGTANLDDPNDTENVGKNIHNNKLLMPPYYAKQVQQIYAVSQGKDNMVGCVYIAYSHSIGITYVWGDNHGGDNDNPENFIVQGDNKVVTIPLPTAPFGYIQLGLI